jgi:tetratricopeptide (TPR) repeat protein/urease accessory protein UreE
MHILADTKGKFIATLMGLLLIAGLFAQIPAYAQVKAQAKASIIRNFARVSFTHEPALKLRSAVKGRQIRLRFDQPVTFSPGPLLGKLKPYVISISQSADKRSVLLTTNREYRTRSFVSGNSAGVDIIGLAKGGVEKEPETPQKTVSKETRKAPAKPKAAPVSKPPLKKVKPAKKPVLPKAQKPEPKVEKKPEPKKEAEAPKKAKPLSKEEVKKPEPPKAPKKPREKVEIIQQPKQTAAPVMPVKMSSQNGVMIKVEKGEEGIILTFPYEERVAAAAFRRGNRHLVLFTSEALMDASDAVREKTIEQMEYYPLQQKEGSATLWEIETPFEGARLEKLTDSYHWKLHLSSEPVLPTTMLQPQPRVEPPLKPHLFVPLLEAANPVKLQDPLIGDEVIMVPLYSDETGLVPPRRFSEFAAPRSSQGFIVTDAWPELRVARTRNGLKITSPDGIVLSKDLPKVELPEPLLEESDGSNIFFSYEDFKAPAEYKDDFAYEGYLWRQAATNNKKQRNIAKRRLAELYLSQGKGMEARGLLTEMAQSAPIYFTRNKLHALLGGAYFLTNQYPQAETAFKHPTLEKNPELELWKDLLSILLTKEGKGNYMDYHGGYIKHYPPLMRQRMALIHANHLIDKKRFNRALRIFDTLQKNDMLPDMQDQLQYLLGRILEGTTQREGARKMWSKLARETTDRYVRARALYAVANLDIADNKVTLKEAIKLLEPIRIIWRGDEFEISLLQLLAKLYEQDNDYRNALRAYREIITYFPNYPENVELTARMADMFRQLFNEGGAEKLTPVEALALYYEFRNLTPIGEEGDKMIRNLADRLAAVELLDRSAKLLQHQVEFRLSGEMRSRIGARLALIHLLRRQPREALKVLELTGYGANPKALQQQRTLLTSRALMGLDEPERSLSLIRGDESREAKLLTLEIHWKTQNWPKLVRVAEGLLGERSDPSLPLDPLETDILMKLAIAYIFDQQKDQLQYLRDYFLPLLADEKSRDFFSFLSEDTPLDYRNIAKLTSQINRMESFLASYRDKIKEGGLSNAVQ